MATKKERSYLDVIRRSLTDVWNHLDEKVELIPEHGNYDSDPITQRLVDDVLAVEAEWILCPVQRAELSLIEFEQPED